MLGKRSDQKGLWEADRLYLDYVGQDTFYGLRMPDCLASCSAMYDFAEIRSGQSRDSVRFSLLDTSRCCCGPTTR